MGGQITSDWGTVMWTYIGNSHIKPQEDGCESVLREDSEIVAIFKCVDENGWALSVSALALLDVGSGSSEGEMMGWDGDKPARVESS